MTATPSFISPDGNVTLTVFTVNGKSHHATVEQEIKKIKIKVMP